MTKNYAAWHGRLTPLQKLAVSFSIYWLYALVFQLIGEWISFLEVASWSYRLIHATWMAFFLTVFVHWRIVKELFKSNKSLMT